MPFDESLKNQMQAGSWVPVESLLQIYSNIKELTNNPTTIADALKLSKSGMIEVSSCGTKIRRSFKIKPLPTFDANWFYERNGRSLYCKGFPRKGLNVEMIWSFFLQFQHAQVVNIEVDFFKNIMYTYTSFYHKISFT